jgi:hypothetical protein
MISSSAARKAGLSAGYRAAAAYSASHPKISPRTLEFKMPVWQLAYRISRVTSVMSRPGRMAFDDGVLDGILKWVDDRDRPATKRR